MRRVDRLTEEEAMPLFISQGRFTPEALRGMLAKPENREAAIRDLVQLSGPRPRQELRDLAERFGVMP